jgi:hypothetical protein
MAAPRNIALQLQAWQKRNRYTPAEAAHELGVPLINYLGWADGIPCRLANLIETRIGVPVSAKRLDARLLGGIIRP